ncbi:hypothetical protein [Alloscardovia sp. HMSC034E08]|uniref:hypothetical protein n=1 Tax=Alloscardovia sp. HMSC034E08 TaxID=1739413 RepID=UPI0008BA4BEF|nr:hypothetical protein [Alloscardovia sp. HMSC034E08]OFQ96670.1 hypothetical protein HMPREF2909_00445 [Alloscardovia sp. HMSC034E08]
MKSYKTRCGQGQILSYKWVSNPKQGIEEVADNLAAKFAGDALADGSVKSSNKEKYEDDLFCFFLAKLELLCSGSQINWYIDSPRLCQKEKLPIFEHRWRYFTNLYKSSLPPSQKTLQIRHYVGEPIILI